MNTLEEKKEITKITKQLNQKPLFKNRIPVKIMFFLIGVYSFLPLSVFLISVIYIEEKLYGFGIVGIIAVNSYIKIKREVTTFKKVVKTTPKDKRTYRLFCYILNEKNSYTHRKYFKIIQKLSKMKIFNVLIFIVMYHIDFLIPNEIFYIKKQREPIMPKINLFR